MAQINYQDKVDLYQQPSIADINKVKASDLNEIKQVVNENDDNVGNLSNLNTTDKTNIVNAINELVGGEWQNMSLENGWEYVGYGNQPQYKKAGNKLYLRGIVINQNVPTGTSRWIAILPEGYRPINANVVTRSIASGGANVFPLDVAIGNNGQITYELGQYKANYRLALDGTVVWLD